MKSDGVEVIGVAVVVSTEHHEALLNQQEAAKDALKKQGDQALVHVHLVTHNSKRQGRLANLMTSLTTSTTKPTTPAVLFVKACGAAITGDNSESDEQQNAVRHCNLVFYDAQVAAKGSLARCARTLSEKSAFHAPLVQVCWTMCGLRDALISRVGWLSNDSYMGY